MLPSRSSDANVRMRDLPLFSQALPTECAEQDSRSTAFGTSMQRVLALASRVAQVDSNVLIVGESGVGKEHLARYIHEQSRRRLGPFTAVNCGALPDALFESELFGYSRGAFTGAVQDRPGIFEAAHNGTLLLDEIGETPLAMQVKLLRALQERQIRRVGDTRERKINVRVIAATNRPLAQDVAERRFRADLFYRLKVVELAIPPLRERTDDLRGLAVSILRRVSQQLGREIGSYTPEAFDRILAYHWPGNVRELENAIERACALASGEVITLEDLPEDVRNHHSTTIGTDFVRPLQTVEREYILAVLRLNHGNKTRTAHQLGIGAATLFRKLRRYSVSP